MSGTASNIKIWQIKYVNKGVDKRSFFRYLLCDAFYTKSLDEKVAVVAILNIIKLLPNRMLAHRR